MDNYLAKKSFSDYFFTMANLEANRLSNLAAKLADRHIKNSLVRSDFKEDIQNFITYQLKSLQNATSDSQCRQCVSNLQQERYYLDKQDRQLSMGSAQIVAVAQLVQKNGIWGYVINGVLVVVSGIAVIVGLGITFTSIATANIVGFAFGGMLALHAANAFQESLDNFKSGNDDAVGFLKKGYIYTVKFLGFNERTGRLAYNYMDLFLSGYGMSRLVLKPEAWRLFHYLRTDHVRNIKNMSRTDLLIEMGNDAITIKSIHEKLKN